MRRMAMILVVLVGVGGDTAGGEADAEAAGLVQAARALVQGLSDGERRALMRPAGGAEQARWTFLPGRRDGLTLLDLDAGKRDLALAVVRAGLSSEGWTRVQGIRAMEQVLRDGLTEAARRRQPEWRHPWLYTLTIFGTPSLRGSWGWRFGGHHLSIHLRIDDGRVVAPILFFGASPAAHRRADGSRLVPLGDVATEFRAVMGSLRPVQAERAWISPRAPAGFLGQPGTDPRRLPQRGVALAVLDAENRAMVRWLVEVYTQAVLPAAAARWRARVAASDPHRTRFAWRGPKDARGAWYARLLGPTFLIEWWKDGQHIHSVARDLVAEGLVRGPDSLGR